MARYYVPFVNFNTLIYEPCGIEPKSGQEIDQLWSSQATSNDYFLTWDRNDTLFVEYGIDGQFYVVQNQLFGRNPSSTDNFVIDITDARIDQRHNVSLPSTASFLTALNLKRNGPYGYPTWRQIRVHENPLIRNQKKKNIITVFNGDSTSYIQPNGPATNYKDTRNLEVFKEPVFSSREKPLVLSFPKGNRIYRATFEMGSKVKYFDNDRLNILYAPYNTLGNIETDVRFKEDFIDKTFKFIGDVNVPILSIEYSHDIFPQKGSLEYDKRIRTNFYHPWKNNRNQRKKPFKRQSGIDYLFEDEYLINNEFTYIHRILKSNSRWPLDPFVDFLTYNSDMISIYGSSYNFTDASFFSPNSDNNYFEGILQNKLRYLEDLQTENRTADFFKSLAPVPRFSYNHTITPLTSCVGPHGMDIEGVNNGSLFNDLSINHIPSGDANWDAGSQYGTNPFYDSYEEFVDDIKRVGKDYSNVPEFRSSLFFKELQRDQSRTPKGFINVLGVIPQFRDISFGEGYNNYWKDRTNSIGTLELGHTSASSEDTNFFEIYSHSDFMRNFDIVQEISNTTNTPLFKMSLTCKAIKKFTPYEGFYPAERTTQIAETFRDSIIDSCFYTGSGVGNNVGDIEIDDKDRYVYFNNIMTPMFAPGIMFNSIKSGLAVGYPIHTSSLSLTNGGVNLYNSDYYIQKPFDHMIPFEALLEPNIYLSNKEIHCSEPHPSGNLSGSATWNGTGDTTEYQFMVHNFLAETANFFLQDQNFSFIESKKSKDTVIDLVSGSTYFLQVSLYKSQNFASKKNPDNAIVAIPDLIMTGSGVQETFTMYSRPSAFGPPSRITSSQGSTQFTASYSDRGQNYPFTPSYYDGKSIIYWVYGATETRRHTIEEIFSGFKFVSYRHSKELVDLEAAENVRRFLLRSNAPGIEPIALVPDSINHAIDSINLNLGFVKEVDLFDDDTSDVVKVAVDISSDQDAQLIIQPKWETPMFNFQSYSHSDTISLPLVGSQSVPRGIWHQYGQIETDPTKGIFMQVEPISPLVADIEFDLAKKLGFSTEPVKLGKTASKKVVREAIVAVPFYEYTPGARAVEQERKFLQIPRGVIQDALEGKGKQNVIDMVNKMQRFVMPPMFNFLEDQEIPPVTMYMFDFKHTFDQEDLGAIWQNLPPKLMTEFQTEEKTISHTFEEDELLSLAAIENIGDPQKIMKHLRWMVFKVKQKAEQNYYDKIVGETQKLNKKSPYSHNWPYDYFSLVELAKIETKVDFAEPLPEVPEIIEPNPVGSPPPVANIPNIGPVRVTPTLRPERKRKQRRRNTMDRPISAPNTRANKRSNSPPQRNTPAPSIPVQNPAPISSNPPKTKTNNKSKRGKKTGMNNIRGTKK